MYIETDRTILRPYAPADLEDYLAYITEPYLQHMLGLRDMDDRDSVAEAFQWLLDEREFIAIVHKESGRAVGHICLHPPLEQVAQDPAFQGKTGFSLTFALAEAQRGKGIMTEALSAAIAYIFAGKKADYIDCEYLPANAPSRRVQEKLGFQPWGADRPDGIELIVNVLRG